MKVILTQDVRKLGKKNDVVEVNSGYAQNFLIKKGLAIAGTNSSLNQNKNLKDAEAFHEEEYKKSMQAEANKIEGKEITLKVKTGVSGKVFGSVTSKEIAAEVENSFKVKVDKKKVNLNHAIKQTGTYPVSIKFYKGIIATIKINIIGKDA